MSTARGWLIYVAACLAAVLLARLTGWEVLPAIGAMLGIIATVVILARRGWDPYPYATAAIRAERQKNG